MSADVHAIRSYIAGHLRAEAQQCDPRDPRDALLREAAGEVDALSDDDARLVTLVALWTRPGPDGLDSFELGSGASRWISRFDPRDETVEQLLDVIIANDAAEEASAVDNEARPAPTERDEEEQ